MDNTEKLPNYKAIATRFFPSVSPLLDPSVRKQAEEALLRVPNSADVELFKRLIKLAAVEAFVHEKNSGELSLLIVASDTGPWIAADGLIRESLMSNNIRRVGFVGSGIALREFRQKYQNLFIQTAASQKLPFMTLNGISPFDAIICTPARYGPEEFFLHNGKTVYQAKRLYFVFEAWGIATRLCKSFNYHDGLDAAFVVDRIAKATLSKSIPNLSPGKFIISGSEQIFSIKSFSNNEIESMRIKLGLKGNEHVGIYLDDFISTEVLVHLGRNPDFMEQTLRGVIKEFLKASSENTDEEFVLLYRPHPGDPFPDKLRKVTANLKLPENFRLIDVSLSNGFSIDEAIITAELVISLGGTENYKAPHRGKSAVFVERSWLGDSADLTEKLSGIYVLDSPANGLMQLIKNSHSLVIDTLGEKESQSPSQRILSYVVSDLRSQVADMPSPKDP